jgi:hypothetical protein
MDMITNFTEQHRTNQVASPRPTLLRQGWLAALAVCAAMLLPGMASASHFRYGQIAWEQDTGNTVDFTVTTAWRVSPFVRLQYGDGSFNDFGQASMTSLGTFTDLAGESYTVWRFTTSYTYGTAGPYTASFESCCRISTLANVPNGSFRVETLVDMNGGNSGGPVSAAPILTQMTQGAINTIPLPVADPDGDAVSCRLATFSESYISSQPSAGGLPLTVTPSCALEWDTTFTSVGQKYAYQVVIEETNGSATTALDGMIEIVGFTINAAPTCSGGGNYTIAPGQTLAVNFVGADPDGDTLTSAILGPPAGSTFGPTAGATPLTSSFSWTPSAGDAGGYASSVSFEDPGGLQGFCALGITVLEPQCDDADEDGVCDDDDNCVDDANADQADDDLDGVGDVCDNCVYLTNSDQADFDLDGDGDVCDICPLDPENDADGDGVCESDDVCPDDYDPGQGDNDGDGAGDVCDPDDDNDGVDDGDDNCPLDANSDQTDTDGDGDGDACDSDDDDDGVPDGDDECPATELGALVDEFGCSIDQYCPCENSWKNHGAYVSCVAHATNDFVDLGLLTETEKGEIMSAAGQSDCGHKNR